MAEIVNLRRHRKRKARQAKADKAEQNRLSHGRGKAEKQATRANRALDDKRLAGHRLTDADD